MEQFRKTLELNPSSSGADRGMRWVYRRQGGYDEAIQEFQEARRLDPPSSWRVANIAAAYAFKVNRVEAMKYLEGLKATEGQRYLSQVALAQIYVALNDKERTIECLERAFRERDSLLPPMRWLADSSRPNLLDPTNSPIWSDERVQAQRDRLHFPPKPNESGAQL
jgi:hypothetical protein